MEPWLDDLTDDLQSMSFNSTTTAATTTATDIHRSTSSGSEATWTATSSSSSSAHHVFPPPPSANHKAHSTPSGDPCWDAIRRARSSYTLSLSDLRFLHRLGSGDIGSVYLAEIKSSEPAPPPAQHSSSTQLAVFAAKVMDKRELAGRNKEGRARTEKEILEMLDHPFLPTLYAAIDSPKWSCLLTEFCPGGDLHVLRQRQPLKRFPESAVRYVNSTTICRYFELLNFGYGDDDEGDDSINKWKGEKVMDDEQEVGVGSPPPGPGGGGDGESVML